MITLSKADIAKMLPDIPFQTEHEKALPPAENPWDFDETNGRFKCVKRGDIADTFRLNPDVPAYGVYLGLVGNHHIVLVRDVRQEAKTLKPVEVMCGEAFADLDELKQRWRLD